MTHERSPERTLLERALEAHRAGRLAEAAALYRAVLESAPAHADARHLLGVVLRQTGHPEAALRTITQALALAPDHAAAQLNRALALMDRQRFAEAADGCRRALRLQPDLAAAGTALAEAEGRSRPPRTVAVTLPAEPGAGVAALLGAAVDAAGPAGYVAVLPAGTALVPDALRALRDRLGQEPDADAVLAGGGDRLPEGAVPPGLWLVRMLEEPRLLRQPGVVLMRAGFVRRCLDLAADADAPLFWGLAGAAARLLRVDGDAALPEPSGHAAGEATVRACVRLRALLRPAVDDAGLARLLRGAVLLRLADWLAGATEAELDHAGAARTPVRALRALLASLPGAGTRRMARVVLRSGVAATAATLAAREHPRPPRMASSLGRPGCTIVPLYAVQPEILDGIRPEGNWTAWCYLGQNAETIAELRRGVLAALPFRPAEADLQATATRHRGAFVTAMHDLLSARPHREAAMLADLSPDTSFVFLNACIVLSALDLLARNDGERRLVVVENPALFQVLLDQAVPEPGRPSWPFVEPDLASLWWRFWRGFTRAGRRWHRRLAALAEAGPAGPAPPALDALFAVYMDAKTVDAQGRWVDRYFGDLPERMQARGLRTGWLWFNYALDLPVERLAALKRENAPVFLYEELAGWRGVVSAILAKFNAWRGAPWMGLRVAGRDLGAILRLELLWAVPSTVDIDRLMFRAAGRALAARGVGVRRIIYPYENQGWEKMLCAGVRRSLPDTRLIGYLHASMSPYYLNFYPDVRHWASPRRPHRLVALSEQQAAHLAASGYPAGDIAVGGALRFAHVFEPQPPDAGTADSVLVVLPNAWPDIQDLLTVVLEGLGPQPDWPVLLKPHPITAARLKGTLRTLPDHVRLFEGTMTEAIARCVVAVYSNGTAGPELLARGKPVIAKWPTGRFPYLDVEPNEAFTVVATPDELVAQVARCFALPPERRAAVSRQAEALATRWFSPPGEGSVAAFLEEPA